MSAAIVDRIVFGFDPGQKQDSDEHDTSWQGEFVMSKRYSVTMPLVAAMVFLAACNPTSTDTSKAAETTTASEAAPTPALTAAEGASPETLAPTAPDAEGETSVLGGIVRFDALPNQSGEGFVRLIGTAGGDPAANGLMTYLVISTAHDSWVYVIGNIIDYRIKGVADGRVDLEIDQTRIADNGEMSTETRKQIVTWTPVPDTYEPGGDWAPVVTKTAAQ